MDGWPSLLLISLFSLNLNASDFPKTLLVSDIDDTIKVSHILSLAAKLGRASDVTTPFRGMAPLYRLIKHQNPQNTYIVYLSNAPQEIAGMPALEYSHKTFLGFNEFPQGAVALRADLHDQNHKINELRRLMETENPELVLLIGDNGERDPEIYHQFYREYSSKARIVTFIHQLYSTKAPFLTPGFIAQVGSRLYPEQIGYVTPVEISLELKNRNILGAAATQWMIDNISPAIVAERRLKWDGLGAVSFPAFKKCGEFVWKWKITADLQPLHKKIMSVCR